MAFVRIVTLFLALVSMALLAWAEEKEQEKKEETQKPTVVDAKDLSEYEQQRLDGAIRVAEQNGKAELKPKTEELKAGLSAIEKRHPEVKIYEMCEYKGWLIYSRTPYLEDNKLARFHDGYAIKKGTKFMGQFGFW